MRVGKYWDRDEDHLAMMTELMGDFPLNMTTLPSSPPDTGRSNSHPAAVNRCEEYFNKEGTHLKHIQNLKYWSLERVLADKYKFMPEDAYQVAQFLNPMLAVSVRCECDAVDECVICMV